MLVPRSFLGVGYKKYSDYANTQLVCPTWYPKTKKTQWITGIGLTVVIGVLGLFFRFGGAFNYTNSINWESAARLSSNLLNETILDDVQALYRVKSIAKRADELEVINLTPQELSEKLVLSAVSLMVRILMVLSQERLQLNV